jgi:hypothetical protein
VKQIVIDPTRFTGRVYCNVEWVVAGRETETGDEKEWHGFSNDFPVRRDFSLREAECQELILLVLKGW